MKKFEKIILKRLNLKKDISKKYQNWMNDFDVHKYTEQKYRKHSLVDIKKFVKEKISQKMNFRMGYF